MSETKDLEVVRDLTLQSVAPRALVEGAIPYALVPEGYNIQELEKLLPAPVRIRQDVKVNDVASLQAYLAIEDPEKHAVVFADVPAGGELSVLAVLDYHRPGAPSFAAHRVKMVFQRSAEWKAWAGQDKQGMAQEAFAQFVEANLPDIVEPSGADLLEIAKSIEATKGVSFASAIRRDNGQREFKYSETIEGSARAGTVAIPERFVLGLRPFAVSEPYRVEAALRYRINSGNLVLWFELVRPHKVIEAAFNDVVAALQAFLGERLILGSLG